MFYDSKHQILQIFVYTILISNPLKDKSHLECFLIENIRI